ncbi:EAL domain-containing protein [Photobacterium phosphoreum]|uniref:EAL domain-containing protein n=1 Tax=Photobacterium phosphoreum TaxID=659 RepID=UPI000D16311B|nr:EAL domain-containing protein [Photobacterium phosphoreum]PSU71755.1 hypothetical protein CTM67_20015 [Photobacterium phosphoreum]
MSFKYQPIVLNNYSLFCFEALYEPSLPMSSKVKELFFFNNRYNHKLQTSIIKDILSEIDNKQKLKNKKISINIPISFLSSVNNINFLSNVKDKSNIILELAEYDNVENLIHLCDKLKNMGFILAIDDYGKGYSNAKRVFKLKDHLDIIKFDKLWLNKNINILKSSFESFYNYDCVIEGVETESQYNLVRNIGFEYIQGFYISKPLSM